MLGSSSTRVPGCRSLSPSTASTTPLTSAPSTMRLVERRRAARAGAAPDVEVVERDGGDANQRLAGLRNGIRQIAVAEHLGRAGLGEPGCLHRPACCVRSTAVRLQHGGRAAHRWHDGREGGRAGELRRTTMTQQGSGAPRDVLSSFWSPLCAIGARGEGGADAPPNVPRSATSERTDLPSRSSAPRSCRKQPRVLVSLSKTNYTHELVIASGTLSVTPLSASQLPLLEPLRPALRPRRRQARRPRGRADRGRRSVVPRLPSATSAAR